MGTSTIMPPCAMPRVTMKTVSVNGPATGRISQVGWFQPQRGATSAAYWMGKDTVWSVDYHSGIDVLAFDESPMLHPRAAAIHASWMSAGAVVGPSASTEADSANRTVVAIADCRFTSKSLSEAPPLDEPPAHSRQLHKSDPCASLRPAASSCKDR